MGKALLSLDEDLASSLALRFAASLATFLDIALQPFHVVPTAGTVPDHLGWVNRSREKLLLATGLDEVQRLLRTEQIDFLQAGGPRVAVGDKDRQIRHELASGDYLLYAEGYPGRPDPADFSRFLACRRFQAAPCPLLLVKNLVPPDRLLLLLDRESDPDRLIPALSNFYGLAGTDLDLTVLLYRSGAGPELVFQERGRNAVMERAAVLLAAAGWPEAEWLVVQGEPAKLAEYMRDHGLVAAVLPPPRAARMELLAQLANPLLLFPAGAMTGSCATPEPAAASSAGGRR